jgi:membrane-associated phospholipid phosphatase
VTPTESGTSRVGGRLPRHARRARRPRTDDIELALSVAFLGAVALAGLSFVVRPGATGLDRFVFSVIPPRPRSIYVVAVTRIGSAPVLVAGALAGFVATIRRDRGRAVALLVAPVVTVLVTDWILKPAVGRRFEGVLSFPSGSVAAVAALASVGVLATPERWRWVSGAVGGTVAVLMAVAVVALGWHYPTDAACGLALGAGTVLLLDWVGRRVAGRPVSTGAARGRDHGIGTAAVHEAGSPARR